MPAPDRVALALVFHVRREQRGRADYLLRLLTSGVQFATSGDIEWEGGWALDDADDAILTGLGVLHGEYPASTYAAEAEAWNAARMRLGAEPHRLPEEPRPETVALAQADLQHNDLA